MKRNQKFEHEKYLRKLNKRYGEAYRESNVLEWVPVEEPQFLGWEVTSYLNDAALKRGDVSNLLKVMEYFKMTRTIFTKKKWVTNIIKGADYRYAESLKQVEKLIDRKTKWGGWVHDLPSHIDRNYMPHFGNTRVTEAQFETVPEYLRKYFVRYTEIGNAWRPDYHYYKLSSVFPLYQLKLKVDKAFSTHRGIPNGEAESEYIKIREKLVQENYWGGRHWGYDNKRCNRVQRKAWNIATNAIAKVADLEQLDELIERQEYYAIGRLARD